MATSCVLIPDSKYSNTESQLFKDLLKITGNNRETTKFIWALSQNSALMKDLGFSDTEEPTATEFLKRLRKANKLLDADSYARYIEAKEGLDKETFETFAEAFDAIQDIKRDYSNVIPLIEEISDKNTYKVSIVRDSAENRAKMAKQEALRNLNTRLTNYVERLGFAVQEVDGLETPGMFSPLNAEENANGLKTAIRIAKSNRGQEVLPEEICHLLVAGFRNNPLMQRLQNLLHENKDFIAEILGEDFELYSDKYNSDIDRLADEAAARLIAQNLINREGISSSIKFISDRVLDKIQDNLSKGNESTIDSFISELTNTVNSIVTSLEEDKNFIDWFDTSAVLNADTLYHLDIKAKNLEQITTKAYEILSKRTKLRSLSGKEGKLLKEDLKAYAELKKNIEKKKYSAGCSGFLEYVVSDCTNLYNQLKDLKERYKSENGGDDRQLIATFKLIRNIETALNAYSDIIRIFSSLSSNEEISSELSEEDIEDIQDIANEANGVLNNLKTLHHDMRIQSLFKFYQRYWGKERVIKLMNGETKTISLQDILESNVGDISGFNRIINSMSDMADPLLQMVDMVYKNATDIRDSKIFSLQQKLGALQKAYTASTGSRDMSWMYEKDSEGKLTGRFISDRDYEKFHKERTAYYNSLKEQNLENAVITIKLKHWDSVHTEPVDVGFGRTERMPIYKSNALKDANLSKAQLDYYNAYLEIKKELDAALPQRRVHLYRAPQKKVDIKDSILHGGNPKTILKRIRDQFVTSIDDTEYGEEIVDKGKHVVLDFGGKEVKKIPVYYTTPLDDMSLLDTNATDALLSYGAMSYNYTSMWSIADVLEVTNSLMQDRTIVQTSGKRKLYEMWKFKDEKFSGDYSTPGANSKEAEKLRNYIDSNVYDRRKERETATFRNKEINTAKVGDQLKQYSSVIGLGYNLFSGTTNVTMGVAQTMLQAVGGEYFGLKDIAKAHLLYNKDLGKVIAESYNDVKSNKLSLAIQRFDALEDYYQELNDTDFNGGVFKKLISKSGPLIFNSLGEHYLHTVSMLAVLNKNKLTVDGKTVSFYDALQTYKNKQGITELLFVDNTTDSDGNILMTPKLLEELEELSKKRISGFTDSENARYKELSEIRDRTNNLMLRMKMLTQQVNHSMHGAFNATDKGDIHRNVIGRLVMQFRQWMPAFYTQRFKSKRVNVITGEEEEGFYRTALTFTLGLLHDLIQLKWNVGTRWKTMSNTAKANVKKAGFEVGLLYIIGLILHGAGGPDKDDPWTANVLKYNLYRLKMELGAAAPTSLAFFDNVKTLIQSPVPAMEDIDRLIRIFDITTMNDIIESGKYKGWNRWVKNAYFATPYVKNINRFVDLVEGDISIFNPYLNPKK